MSSRRMRPRQRLEPRRKKAGAFKEQGAGEVEAKGSGRECKETEREYKGSRMGSKEIK